MVPTHPLSTVHCTLAAQPPQPAELSQHHAGSGQGTHMSQYCVLTWALISESFICSSAEFACLFFFATSVNPPGIKVPDRIFTFLHLPSCSEYMHSHAKLQMEWSHLTFMQDRCYLSDDISHFAFYRSFSL